MTDFESLLAHVCGTSLLPVLTREDGEHHPTPVPPRSVFISLLYKATSIWDQGLSQVGLRPHPEESSTNRWGTVSVVPSSTGRTRAGRSGPTTVPRRPHVDPSFPR